MTEREKFFRLLRFVLMGLLLLLALSVVWVLLQTVGTHGGPGAG
jgi:hypothetical protein